MVAVTVWQAFVEKAKLKKGQKVFIQAGSGGVGTIAIQYAKHLGASVATTTSANNFELVKSLGADVVVDYKTQDFETILKEYDLGLNSQDEKTLFTNCRDYPTKADFRSTLYWNPEVKTDEKGEADISFYTSDEKGKFLITIEGVGERGEISSKKIILEVE